MIRWWLACVALCLSASLSARALCVDAQPQLDWDQSLLNDTARVLAGLDAPLESALAADLDIDGLTRHRDFMVRAWDALNAKQLDAVRSFSAREIGTVKDAPQRIFYPFSGPDALYLLSLFPDARLSVLTGLEPVGAVPVLSTLSAQEIDSSLAELRKSLQAILAFSFFRTNDMTIDLRRNRFVGVTPVLFAFIAQAGYAIFDVHYVLLMPDGELCNADVAQIAKPPANYLPGVEIEYFAPQQADFRRLLYLAADIGDGGLRKTPQYVAFVRGFDPQWTYLKSASYLMHKPYFSLIRKLILDSSEYVLQDDSGVPHAWFGADRWDAHLFGRYVSPIGLFSNWKQRDLAEAYRHDDPQPLAFGIGYQHRKNQSNLQRYDKRAPVATTRGR